MNNRQHAHMTTMANQTSRHTWAPEKAPQISVYADSVHLHSTISTTPPIMRAHPDLNQGPADLQSAALTTELCTR